MSEATPVEDLTRDEAAVELERLAGLIAEADAAYYQEDAPLMTDAEYDAARQRNAAIEARFPELGDQITQLVHTHESICRRVKRMTHQLSRPLPQVRADVRSLSAQLDELVGTLEEHNDEEQKIFAAALKNLTSDERIELLDKKLAL